MELATKAGYAGATLLRVGGGRTVGRTVRAGRSCPRPIHQYGKGQAVPLFSLARTSRLAKKPLSNEARFSAVVMGPGVGGATSKVPRYGWLFSSNVRRYLRNLHETMVRDRRPLQSLGIRAKTNLSNICGHASFVALAFAYLETDVLLLRGYAASGIGLSVLFQFYRAQPLWIPIGWNGLFMLINVTMIGMLLKERKDAGKIGEDPEQEGIFREVFMPVELSPVDFVRLVDLGERRVIKKGELLSEAGVTQEEVFLIVEGTAEVESDGLTVGRLDPRQFVGSMAFQQFITNNTPSSSQQKGGDIADSPMVDSTVAYRSTDSNPSVSSTSNDDKVEDLDDVRDGSPTAGCEGVFKEARKAGEVALGMIRHDSIVGMVAQSLLPETQLVAAGEARGRNGGLWATPLEPSSTTVTATTDVRADSVEDSVSALRADVVVVYAWDMHLLRAYIRRHPAAGVAVQTAISADLIRKVDQSRGQTERYRLWLTEALAGGEITPIEKKKLKRFRQDHGISMAMHCELLEQNDWTEEDFKAGFQKGVAPRDGSKDLLKYEALLKRELAKGEVEDEARQHLRHFRKKAGIDDQEHLLVLNKQGWTADDYEAGGKDEAAYVKQQHVPVEHTADPVKEDEAK